MAEKSGFFTLLNIAKNARLNRQMNLSNAVIKTIQSHNGHIGFLLYKKGAPRKNNWDLENTEGLVTYFSKRCYKFVYAKQFKFGYVINVSFLNFMSTYIKMLMLLNQSLTTSILSEK